MYDGDCGFCTSPALWLERHGDCAIAPWQSLDLDTIGLTEAEVTSAAYWLDETGSVSARGAGAVAESLKTCRPVWRVLGHVIYARPMRPLADLGYARGPQPASTAGQHVRDPRSPIAPSPG